MSAACCTLRARAYSTVQLAVSSAAAQEAAAGPDQTTEDAAGATANAAGDAAGAAEGAAADAAPEPSIEDVVRMLREQQQALDARVGQLEAQNRLLGQQRDELSQQVDRLQQQTDKLDQHDQLAAQSAQPEEPSDQEQAIRARLESLESAVANATQRETTTTYDASAFPGRTSSRARRVSARRRDSSQGRFRPAGRAAATSRPL